MSREPERERQKFKMGYGWTPALDDSDPRVRHLARQALYGNTSGKVKRYGRKRAKSPRMPGALDGDVDRFLAALRDSADDRHAWRKQIRREYGFAFEDVRRVTAIKGRPPNELKPLRDRVAITFAELVARETASTQRGRRVVRQALIILYDLEEQQLDRLVRAGRRLLRESEGSVAVSREADRRARGTEEFDEDEDAGLDVGVAGDAPHFDRDTGHFR